MRDKAPSTRAPGSTLSPARGRRQPPDLQPSTAAQYLPHLRRQALSVWRTPLIVFTPKSLLRHAASSSPIGDFAASHFMAVLGDDEVREARRVLVCTGKVGHQLRAERARRKNTDTAVVSIEQLTPFPSRELGAEFARHSPGSEIVWVQEEPANMGARTFIVPRLRRLLAGRAVRSIRRSASASPATGSSKAHEIEQNTLLAMAFADRVSRILADHQRLCRGLQRIPFESRPEPLINADAGSDLPKIGLPPTPHLVSDAAFSRESCFVPECRSRPRLHRPLLLDLIGTFVFSSAAQHHSPIIGPRTSQSRRWGEPLT